ncbi:FAD:protein FMN transferase [Synergistaceae bacterium OttesenSCG-928-D05]|nr:FAD:protein FMN transferase [Synergistaceae bacterium OttesenSCG-928-D05]
MNLENVTRQKQNKKILLALFLLIALCVLALMYVQARQIKRVDVESFKLGTLVRISAWGGSETQVASLIDGALQEVDRLEKLFSANIPDSEVSEINKNAGVLPVRVSGETYELASRSLYWARQTNGAFDPTIGPVVALWGIGTNHAKVPADEEIEKAISLLGYEKLRFSSGMEDDYALFLTQKGQRLDFGAIAKGQVADFAADALKRGGVRSALIDLGGNIVVFGEAPRGKMWKLGIQHPGKPRGEYFGVIAVADESVVTSGRYERFFESGGVRYHHIFDPATGRPSQSDLSSVTIVDKRSADADALSTALFVMGLRKAAEFLKQNPEINAILVSDEGEKSCVYITQNLAPRFSLSNKTMRFEVLE